MYPDAAIIIFNPSIERLRNNIINLLDQVDKIILVDNNSENKTEIEQLSFQLKTRLIHNSENLGIAKALNQAFEAASVEGVEWLLTMDQDSIMPANAVDTLSQSCRDNVGIVCPVIHDLNSGEVGSTVNTIEEIDRCITSGSLTNIKAWRDIGGFDEKMFIDGVDHDFCLRLNTQGYCILRDHRVVMDHEIGHITSHRMLFWDIKVKNHNAFRKYYIAKNIVYFDRKHKVNSYPIKTIMRVIKQILLVLFFENGKIEKIRNLVNGSIDGFKMHLNNLKNS